MTRLGIVTGLAAEARCLGAIAQHQHIVITAANGDAARAAERLMAEGAGALMSFGVAGGLDPSLKTGALIVATVVIAPDGETYVCDADWRDRLSGVFTARPSVVMGSDAPIASVSDKRALNARHNAAAVDMESHKLARIAARAGLPFAALRVIADAADRALPDAALAGFDDQGAVRIGPVLGELARRPWELPDLVRVALDMRKAMSALRACADADGLLLGGG